jgi:hypothetical protein
MKFNLEAAPQKFAELAHVVGAGSSGEAFVPWLAQLKRTIGIAPNLSTLGVKREHMPRLVDLAVKDICHQTNPRKVSAADFEGFFAAAL